MSENDKARVYSLYPTKRVYPVLVTLLRITHRDGEGVSKVSTVHFPYNSAIIEWDNLTNLCGVRVTRYSGHQVMEVVLPGWSVAVHVTDSVQNKLLPRIIDSSCAIEIPKLMNSKVLQKCADTGVFFIRCRKGTLVVIPEQNDNPGLRRVTANIADHLFDRGPGFLEFFTWKHNWLAAEAIEAEQIKKIAPENQVVWATLLYGIKELSDRFTAMEWGVEIARE